LVDHLPLAAVVDDVDDDDDDVVVVVVVVDDDDDDDDDDVVVGEVVGSVLEMGLKSHEKYWINFFSKLSISRSTNNMFRFECLTSSLYDLH
jgi:hypothetical protein